MGPKKKWSVHHPKRPRDEEQGKHGAGAVDDDNSCGGGGGDGGRDGGDSHRQQQGGPKKKSRRAAVIKISNVKGHQAVFGTCDVRNDRQATSELVDLLNTFSEELYPEDEEQEGKMATEMPPAVMASPGPEDQVASDCGRNNSTTAAVAGDENCDAAKAKSSASDSDKSTATLTVVTQQHLSVEEMVRQEANALRAGKDKAHRFKSVNTNVKGVVMVCVMDPKIDVVRLVDAMFAEIRRTQKRRSRFLERVTPMTTTAYPELEAFKTAAESMVAAALPPVADGVPPLAVDKIAKPSLKTSKAAEAGTTSDASKEESKTTMVTAEGVSAAGNGTPKAEDAGGINANSAVEKADTAREFLKNGMPSAEGDERVAAESDDAGKEEQSDATVVAEGAGGDGETDGGKVRKTCDKRWKFRVDVRRRNSALKRMGLINAVADSVGKGHSVSMSSPNVSFELCLMPVRVSGNVGVELLSY